MLQILINNVDYTKYVSSGSLVIEDKLNQPSNCSFTLENIDNVFAVPTREMYVQVFSKQYNKYVFTGFIANDISKDFVGLNGKTISTRFQSYRYSIQCSGDEYLLGAKAVPILPPFVNLGAGQILALLAQALAPGFFDTTSQVVSGDLVPYMEYDPNKTWVDVAKTLADQFRYRVRIRNKVLYYKPWGDLTFPITYDDTLSERTFDPKLLKTTIFDSSLVNDAFVLGDTEAGDNHEDYFVGDGFTGNFPLRYSTFESSSDLLLKQDWTGGGIDTSQWFEQDPTNVLTPSQALNINGGTGNLGETYLYLRTGIDLGRKTILEHGEVFFVGNASGDKQLGIDTFVRANANPLSGPWTTGNGESALQISSNSVEASVINTKCSAFYNSATWTNDQYSEITVGAATTGSEFLSPTVRQSNSAETMYTGSLMGPLGPTATLTISKVIAGVPTTLAGPIVLSVNSGDKLRIEVTGTTLVLKLNGAIKLQAIDSAIISGSAGMFIFAGTLVNGKITGWNGGSLDAATIIGGVYDNANTFAEVSGSGQCECGFDVRPAPGLTLAISVSGVSGLQIQPKRLGQLFGQPLITLQNHYYILKTIIDGKSHNRYTSTFKSFTGAIVQGGTNTALADITWVILDINLNNTNPNQPGFVNVQPPITEYRFTLKDQAIPAFGLYSLVNVSNANFTVQWTSLFDPPQGSLSVAALSGVSAAQLPILPSNIGLSLGYELGFGLGRQVATVTNSGNSGDGIGGQLQFYSDSLPGVGSRIRFQAWEAQTAIARVQDSASIAREAAIVGDDGHRMAMLTDFKPLPRSSEECELAGKAALLDRTSTIYQGSYGPIRDIFFNLVSNDYPRTGEFFTINSPNRGINNLKVLVSSVKFQYVETMSEQANITVSFGPTKFLENLLATFITKPNDVLMPKDTAAKPTPVQLANVGSSFAGDLDFAGLYPRNNLLLWSEQFDNVIWTKDDTPTITANNVTDPLGGQTAETFTKGAGPFTDLAQLYQKLAGDASSGPLTFSIWAKVSSGSLQATITASDYLLHQTAIAIVLTTAWQRFSVTAPKGSNTNTGFIAGGINHLAGTPAGTSMQIWGAQLEFSDHASNYVQTTTAQALNAPPALGFDSLNAYFDIGATPVTAVEVRRSNFGWGVQNNDLLGKFTTRVFSLPRTQFDQTWYLRQVNGPFISRRSKVIRIAAPIIPAAPGLLGVDSSVIQANFNGDIRNVYGIELRGPDNTTVITQKPVGGITDMYFDLKKLNAGRFWQSQNMLLFTEEFDNPIWIKSNASVVSDATIDPNGLGTNGDLLSFGGTTTGVTGTVAQIVNVASVPGKDPAPLQGRQFTFSVWLKTSGGTSNIDLVIADSPFSNVIGFTSITVTSTWTRYNFTISVPVGSNQSLQAQIRSRNIGMSAVYAWGAQLEESTVMNGYIVNADIYGPKNLLQATEEFENPDIWLPTASSSVTAGFVQYALPYNKLGIVTSGTIFPVNAGFDDFGSSIDSLLLGTTLNFAGAQYAFGTPNINNTMACNGQILPIAPGFYNSFRMIGAGIGFSPTFSGSFIANYSDGSSIVFPQIFSNWARTVTPAAGELFAKTMSSRDLNNGTQTSAVAVSVFHYQFNLDPSKRLISITCPANRGVDILAMDLFPVAYSLSVTKNMVIDPQSNLLADQINFGPKAVNTNDEIAQVILPAVVKNKTFTFSIWLRTSGANVAASVFVEDNPFTQAPIGSAAVTVTNQWQQFIFTGTFNSTPNSRIRAYIRNSTFAAAAGAILIYAWGAQLEYGNTATTYLGNGNVLRTFYLSFFNTLWAYGPTTQVIISAPPAPIITLGTKLSNNIEIRLDQLNRNDIKRTTLQLSLDGTFQTGSTITATGAGQPPSFNLNVTSVALSAFFVRAKRDDFFNQGSWSSILFIPYGNIVASTWIGNQGSITPTLDNQATSLFTYTASADAPGGVNTGRIVVTWPDFIITYPDQTAQVVAASSYDTGKVLTTSTSATTPYIFYPRIRAQVPGSVPEFVNGPHTTQTVADAQITQADGYISLGGGKLSLTFTVPAAPASGPPSSSGGSDGGNACVPIDEKLTTLEGKINAEDTTLEHFLLGADTDNQATHWNKVKAFKSGTARCVEIELEDGSKGKCSNGTEVPVWINGEFFYKKPFELNTSMKMCNINSQLSNIKSIVDIGTHRVMMIEVIPYHTIFAGDILTHNGITPKQ